MKAANKEGRVGKVCVSRADVTDIWARKIQQDTGDTVQEEIPVTARYGCLCIWSVGNAERERARERERKGVMREADEASTA